MEYRYLGETGFKVSVLGLGCANFGERTSEKEAEKIILRAFERGINFLDTANVYPNQGLEGKSESIIGKIIQKHKLRDEFFVATKVRARMSNRPNDSGLSKYHIMKQINNSLQRLRTDHVDLYQFHRPDYNTSVMGQLSTISDLVRNNKILYFGLSSFEPWEVIDFLWTSEKMNCPRCVSLQSRYNLFNRSIEADTITVCNKYKIGLLAYNALDGGLLTGKYRLNESQPQEGRHTIWKLDFEKPKNKKKLEKVEQLLEITKTKKISLTQLSIAWMLHNQNIVSCITGPRAVEQLDEYIAALEITLPPSILEKINAICPPPEVWKPSASSMFR